MSTTPEPVSRIGKAIANTELTVTSPDRCVVVKLVGGSDLTARLARGSFDRHTEESLGRTITDTLKSTSHALNHAIRQLRDETTN